MQNYFFKIEQIEDGFFAEIYRLTLRGDIVVIETTPLCAEAAEATRLAEIQCQQKEAALLGRKKIRQEAWHYEQLSFRELAQVWEFATNETATRIFTRKVNELQGLMLVEMVTKLGYEETEAKQTIREQIGEQIEEWVVNAETGNLDEIDSQLDSNEWNRTEWVLKQTHALFHVASEFATDILSQICATQFNKVITLISEDTIQEFSISEYGQIGTRDEHKQLFLKMVDDCLQSMGSMVIRQTIPDKDLRILMPDGTIKEIPTKHLYGFLLKQGELYSVAKEELKDIYQGQIELGMEFHNGEELFFESM